MWMSESFTKADIHELMLGKTDRMTFDANGLMSTMLTPKSQRL
jgi:hypothetical protein